MEKECSGMETNSKCQAYCINDPSAPFNITCLGGRKWTALKRCYCTKPNMTQAMTGNCEKISAGKICSVTCKIGYLMIGNGSVQCDDMLQWTGFPSCQKTYCQLPDFNNTLLVAREDCSYLETGNECHLECRNGGTIEPHDNITCISRSLWTPFPNCTCPQPILGENVVTEGDCQKLSPGGKCFLKCAKQYLFQGQKSIRCGEDGLWERSSSTCVRRTCQKPKLNPAILPAENCDFKDIGENCTVVCRRRGSILGPNRIRCLNFTHWSEGPRCACPPPLLPRDMQTRGNCSEKRPGEECELECPDDMKLEGNKTTVCLETTEWTRIPICVVRHCPKVKLPAVLSYDEDCSRVAPSMRCHLTCTEGGTLIGSNSIVCLGGRKWSPFPKCTCPPPNLTDNLVTTANCESVEIGSACKLACSMHYTLVGNSSILCKPSTRWSALPRCQANFCSNPILPRQLRFTELCISISENEECQVQCRGNRSIIGPSKIVCKGRDSTLRWSDRVPTCTCPPPELPRAFVPAENCDEKQPREKCQVRCRLPNHRFTGKDFVTCGNDSNWRKLQAKCVKIICRNPVLPATLMKDEDCSSKSILETCSISCRTGGNLLGPANIVCQENLTWSEFPTCTCPVPILPGDLEMVGNCSHVKPGESCSVKCNEGVKGMIPILCLNDTTWQEDPTCEPTYCTKPTLPSSLVFVENCDSKVVGESCSVICKAGLTKGLDRTTCLDLTTWSDVPECVCPPLELEEPLKMKTSCLEVGDGGNCTLQCLYSFKMVGSEEIVCRNGTWSDLPYCACIALKDTMSDLEAPDDCAMTRTSQKCYVRCKNGVKLIDNSILCAKDGTWHELPSCNTRELRRSSAGQNPMQNSRSSRGVF